MKFSFEKMKKQLNENFFAKEKDEKTIIVNVPFYDINGESFPVQIKDLGKYIVIGDMGDTLDKLFTNKQEYLESKSDIEEILSDYKMKLNIDGEIQLICESNQVELKLGHFLQALSIINYFFKE